MPNWVTNQLYLKNSSDAKYVLRPDEEAYNDERMSVDFNILVPRTDSVDSYAWSVENWGTKWNAKETEKADATDVIIFKTPWSYPDKWAEALAKFADFTLVYSEENVGSNCGWITYSGGEVVAEWFTDAIRRAESFKHYVDACAMSLYGQGYLYDYDSEDARANFICTFELDDMQHVSESSSAQALIEAYDNLPKLLTEILPPWLAEEEDLKYYARR